MRRVYRPHPYAVTGARAPHGLPAIAQREGGPDTLVARVHHRLGDRRPADPGEHLLRGRRVRRGRRAPQPRPPAERRRQRLARQLLPFVQHPAELDRYVAVSQVGITLSSLILGAVGQGTVAVALAPYLAALVGPRARARPRPRRPSPC